MGRKKKDFRLHLLQGTAKDKGKLESRPAPVTGRWNCPSYFGEPAKWFHKNFFGYAEAMGRISEADKPSWWNLCMIWQRIMEAEAAISKHGILVKGRSGALVKNPAVTVLKTERAAFFKERRVFALDPQSRAELGYKFASVKDEYEKYLAKNRGKPSMSDMID